MKTLTTTKRFFLLLIFALFFKNANAQTVLELYLPFDEGKGNVAYDKVSNMSARLFNVEWVKGKSGHALQFNGLGQTNGAKNASFVDLSENLNNTFFRNFDDGSFTIEVWIKPNPAAGMREIINTGTEEGPGYRLFLDGDRCVFRSGTGYQSSGGQYWDICSAPGTLNFSEWNHLAITRDDSGVATLYVNGMPNAKTKSLYQVTNGDRALTIGSFLRGLAYGFNGAIDELKIYKGAKTSSEIFWDAVGTLPVGQDGKFQDSFERGAKIYSSFITHTDNENLKKENMAEVQTTVIFNYDKDYLYFRIICDEPLVSKMKLEAKRDELVPVYNDDSIEIMLDGNNDKENYCHFMVSASGYKYRGECMQGGNIFLPSENDFWIAKTEIKKDKWIAEVIIPYAILNTEERLGPEMFFNVARNRRASGTANMSSLIKGGQYHRPEYFKKLPIKGVSFEKYNNWKIGTAKLAKSYYNGDFLRAETNSVLKNSNIHQKKIRVTSFLTIDNDTFLYSNPMNLTVGPGEKAVNITSSYNVATPGNGRLFSMVEEEGTPVLLSRKNLGRIEFTPIKLSILRPFYRNNIYATQKIAELKIQADLGLKAEEIAKSKLEISLRDSKGKRIASQTYARLKEENLLSLPVADLPEGNYNLCATLMRGTVETGKVTVVIRKLPSPDGNEVRIDENRCLILNGKPVLPVIWWTTWGANISQPPAGILETGADGMLVGLTRPNPSVPKPLWDVTFNPKALKEPLDYLQQKGQLGILYLHSGEGKIPKAISDGTKFFKDNHELSPETKGVIAEEINFVKNHPALLAYDLIDEPETISYRSMPIMKAVYEYIRDLDPYHPIYICNCSVNGMLEYLGCMDMDAPDLGYLSPIKGNILSWSSMSKIPAGINAYLEAGNRRKLPGFTFQAFNWGTFKGGSQGHIDDREPTFVEERCMLYLAIVHGGRYFNYFIYGDGAGSAEYCPDLKFGFPYLFKELRQVSKTVLSGEDVKGIGVSDARINFLAKKYQGNILIIAVNASTERRQAMIQLPPSEKIGKLVLVSENRVIDCKNNAITDTFAPYEVHIYSTALTVPSLSSLAEIESRIKKSGGIFSFGN